MANKAHCIAGVKSCTAFSFTGQLLLALHIHCQCNLSNVLNTITGNEVKKEAEEAEYAWLALDSLKPFREGDGETVEGEDPLLKGSIAAAEQALAAAAARAQDEEQAADSGAESMSDSDGGTQQSSIGDICTGSAVEHLHRHRYLLCTPLGTSQCASD